MQKYSQGHGKWNWERGESEFEKDKECKRKRKTDKTDQESYAKIRFENSRASTDSS